MSTSTKPGVTNSGPSAVFRTLPAVVYFPGDEVAFTATTGLQQYLRLSFDDFAKGRKSETIVVTSLERMILEKAAQLRAPNVRVIALSDWRFKDPRTDGVVYAYLPTHTPPGLVERTIDNALDHIHLLATRRDVNERLAGATLEIHELSAIGAALSAEHDGDKVLEMVLANSCRLTGADAGSLYVMEEAETPDSKTRKVLHLKRCQNDSTNRVFNDERISVSDKTIAGYVALTGEAINVDDAYHLPDGVPYQISRKLDEEMGYRTKSVLTVPMRDQRGQIVGVLQLVNAKRHAEVKLTSIKVVASEVIPFSVRQQAIAMSLATQGAVALENSRLIKELSARAKAR